MAHVYISYAPEDFEFADNLVHWLDRSGFTAWIDAQSQEMPAGKDWRQEIDDAIRRAFALVVIVTPGAAASEYVTYEWTFALGIGVRVVPVLLENTELPPRLKALTALDFTRRAARPWNALIQAVKEIEADYQFMLTTLAQDAPPMARQLVTAINQRDSRGVQTAINALSATDDWAAREALSSLLRHPAKNVRTTVALALARLGDTRTIPNLLETMRDGSTELRRAALRALVEIDADAVLELVTDALKDDNRRIQWAASRVDRGIPRHVFLSYSHVDRAHMTRLRDDLAEERLMVWTDEALTPGTASWQIAIENAIENAGCLVVLLSPEAKKSEWVRAELDHARLHKISVFPVLARGDEASAVPFGFTSAQWTDIRTNYTLEVQRLIEAIHRHLRQVEPATRGQNRRAEV